MANDIVKFLRQRDYQLVRELGQGACGQTVLLFDDLIDEHFVCKKFAPYREERRKELFENFVRETKILHRIYHENVVRVFNYYLYPDALTGYILMEFVEGSDIEDFLASSPEMINEVFLQAISGFQYLEVHGILHRDIRPLNLLVKADGALKIIDFGFGKQVQAPEDFDKSVSLNWWCEPPDEFSGGVYDFGTEVYFVGKLFERIIQENALDDFKYGNLLGKMCQRSPIDRTTSFLEIERNVQSDRFFEIDFSEDEVASYRHFSDALAAQITKIEGGAKFQDDIDRVLTGLENVYRSFMLEETVPDSTAVAGCFIHGVYYRKAAGLSVRVVKNFLQMLKAASPEKRRIIMSNLNMRLNAIPRYDEKTEYDDDIPF